MVYNFLRSLINILQWVLITLSLIAVFFVILDLISLNFEFSESGYITFLELFYTYSFLFAATFIVISVNIGLVKISMTHDSNLKSYMVNSRTVWMQTIKEFYSEIKSSDPFLVKDFNKNLISIHDYLFEINFIISSKKELETFFIKYFKDRVYLYEKMNRDMKDIRCYSNVNHSFSFPSFEYLLYVAIEFKNCYSGFRDDLFNLYMAEVKKVQEQSLVNAKTYNERMVKLITEK